jgi:DNA-binding response OmpR family regulator
MLAESEDPDVILLDVLMPGMDGFEVCKRLKSNPKTHLIPIVFLTALSGENQERVHAMEVGGDAFLSRPTNEMELIAQIRAMQKIKRATLLLQSERDNLEQRVFKQTKEL